MALRMPQHRLARRPAGATKTFFMQEAAANELAEAAGEPAGFTER
jgi:hypothetical protein